MLNDPVADMLTRIRNAVQQKHRYVDISLSKHNIAILGVLKEAGFIEHFTAHREERVIRVMLKYTELRESIIQGLRRLSSPGKRTYVGWLDVPIVQRGLGISVVSTSKGVMNGQHARHHKLGGELICTVW